MVSKKSFDSYSEIVDQQLDVLESQSDIRLNNEIIKVCGQIFDDPNGIKIFSSVIRTAEGTRYSTSVPGGYPYKVFWSISPKGSVRIEAIFPHTK